VAILDLVKIFEAVMDRRAYYDLIESGGSYEIDVTPALSAANEAGIAFDENYINNLIPEILCRLMPRHICRS
jgi:hypothetical protein